VPGIAAPRARDARSPAIPAAPYWCSLAKLASSISYFGVWSTFLARSIAMNRAKNKSPNKPFFTRFLEEQKLKDVAGGIINPPDTTQKFPSDNDEDVL
jgi:hypothetical protein